jgi:hypothetical protein
VHKSQRVSESTHDFRCCQGKLCPKHYGKMYRKLDVYSCRTRTVNANASTRHSLAHFAPIRFNRIVSFWCDSQCRGPRCHLLSAYLCSPFKSRCKQNSAHKPLRSRTKLLHARSAAALLPKLLRTCDPGGPSVTAPDAKMNLPPSAVVRRSAMHVSPVANMQSVARWWSHVT